MLPLNTLLAALTLFSAYYLYAFAMVRGADATSQTVGCWAVALALYTVLLHPPVVYAEQWAAHALPPLLQQPQQASWRLSAALTLALHTHILPSAAATASAPGSALGPPSAAALAAALAALAPVEALLRCWRLADSPHALLRAALLQAAYAAACSSLRSRAAGELELELEGILKGSSSSSSSGREEGTGESQRQAHRLSSAVSSGSSSGSDPLVVHSRLPSTPGSAFPAAASSVSGSSAVLPPLRAALFPPRALPLQLQSLGEGLPQLGEAGAAAAAAAELAARRARALAVAGGAPRGVLLAGPPPRAALPPRLLPRGLALAGAASLVGIGGARGLPRGMPRPLPPMGPMGARR